jgi:toxin-antitoxin system PIN domain toxin
MRAFLLDVNVLLALSWPEHKFHERVQSWFRDHGAKGWATCPMVQASFVRIVSNPAFSPRAVSPKEALDSLAANTRHPGHQFWPDDIAVAEGLMSLRSRIVGHQQITDAYLLALATHHRGKLATLDKGILAWGSESAVELIG